MFKVLYQTCVLNASINTSTILNFLLFHLIGPEIITESLGAPNSYQPQAKLFACQGQNVSL